MMLVWVGVLLSRFVAVYAARVALFITSAARSCITLSQKHHCARDGESKGRHCEAEREEPHAALLEFSPGAGENEDRGKQHSVREILAGNIACAAGVL
jgi:hypothetical protein